MLSIQHVNKRLGDRPVLHDLSIHIHTGEVYGLLGPNGAGKTTTINLICNLLKPDSGTIVVNGQPVTEATCRWVGIVPQENLLYRSLTCAENLSFFARIYGVPRRQRAARVAQCLQAVNLHDRANAQVETLSGGMQRRLSMAIALVHQPKLVILDEPTTGLDVEARYEIWELIRQLKHQGITTLFTTHLLEEAERLCHRIGLLKQGRLLTEGSLADLQQHIAAEEILVLETEDEERAIARATKLGYTCRYYGGDLALWLPKRQELQTILQNFDGIPIRSISRQPVRLEHIYMELTQQRVPPLPAFEGAALQSSNLPPLNPQH